MKKVFTLLMLAFLFVFVTSSAFAQAVTTNQGSGLAATYSTLADAITALNGATINSPVVITLTGNETAPAGGYVITASGDATNTILIQGSSSTITAGLQTAGIQSDAIFKIVGGDWITIQNFTMQENAGNTVITPIGSQTMTEYGVALFLTTATNGAQNNTIQNNIISLGSTYPNAIGIMSTSSNSSTHGTLAATSSAGTNSFNKFYSNTISNVAYGMYFICEPMTATIFETGIDIGGSSSSTANTIIFGNATTATFSNLNRFSSVLPAGITFRNGGAGNNVRFNTITSNNLAYAQSGGLGGIVTTIGTAATGVTYTSTWSNNTITLSNTGTTAITGIDFGYGLSTGTIISSNNNITLNQATTAAASAAIIGIRANYASATNTLNTNTITVNQSPGTAGALTSPVTGITAAGVGTTVNVNSNVITFKQAAPGGTASYGSGAITYISVAAGSGTVNVNSNQLLTTGSTIRSTGNSIGINHDATITVGITINLNTINIDRVAASGTIWGTYETGTPSGVNPTITNNSITFTNLAGTTAATAIQTNGGPTGLTVKVVNGNTISVSGTNSGTVIGVSVQYSNNSTINNNNITVSSAGPTVTGIQALTSTSAHTLTGNTFSLTSSTTSPTAMTAINVGGTGPFQIYNNTFTAMNFTGIITSAPTVSGISVSAGTGNNIYNNEIKNINVGAATSSGNPVVRAIIIAGGVSTNVYRNKIYGITTLATGATTLVSGITISGGGTATPFNTVYNNLIGDLAAPAATNPDAIRGINITSTATSTHNIYYNTVVLSGTGGTNFGSSGIFHTASATATTAALNLRNNIIVNNTTPNGTGLSVAFRRSGTALANYASTSNNNSLFAPTIMHDGTTAYTMETYKTLVAPRDGASFSENPTFISTSGASPDFLHLSLTQPTQCEAGAQPIAGITDDFDGVTRNATTPDVGADEGDFIMLDLAPPTISYSPLLNTGSTSARTLVVTVTDASGVPTTDPGWPYLYWMKTGDASWTAVPPTSVAGSQYTFNFGAGVSEGNTVSYYIVAQDLASPPNVGASPSAGAGGFTANPPAASTPPTTPSSYLITAAPLAGDYTVGVNLFKQITGKDIYFEKSIQKVLMEVPVLDEPREKGTPEEYRMDLLSGKTKFVEVEQISWIAMENGKPYTGDLYVKKSENPSLKFPEGTEGVYTTITAAIADLNLRGVSAATSFTLVDATYPTETYPITIDVTNEYVPTSANPVTLRPASGLGVTVSGSSAVALFKLNGADYITFDGLNTGGSSLTFENSNTGTSSAVIWIGSKSATNGATFNTIKNTTIIGNAPTTTLGGIVISSGTTIGGVAEAQNNNNTISNNDVRKSYFGIAAVGPIGNESGLLITGNTVGSTVPGDKIGLNGIAVFQQQNAVVSNNTIVGVVTATSSTTAGIRVAGTANGILINANKISDVKNTNTGGYSAIGISLNSSSIPANVSVTNNFIWDVTGYGWSSTSTDNGYGINILSGGGYNLYHNSVNLATNQTATGGVPACLIINSAITTANTLDIRNNIFTIPATVGTNRFAVLSNAANTVFADINYNDYFTSGPNLGFIGSNRADLAAWRIGTGKDLQSVQGDPLFIDNTNLHINPLLVSPVSNAGFYLASVPTDIDGDTRLNPPDIGADEYTGVMPAAFALLSPANGATGVALNGSLTWETSTYANNYDVYLDKVDATTLVSPNQTGTIYDYVNLDASTTYYWKVVAKNANGTTLATGAPYSFTTVALLPPNPPTDLVLSNITNDAMDLSWTDASSDETGFYIYKSLNGTTFTQVDVVGADVTTYTGDASRTLGVNTRVWWRVSAYNANGESGFTAANAFTLANTPGAPILSDVAISTMKVTLDAAGNPASTEFVVRAVYGTTTKYMNTAGALVDTEVWGTYAGFGGATGRTATGLSPNTNYTFDVKARNGNNIETIYGTSASALTLSYPSSLSENFATYTGFAPPPVGWNEGDEKNILDGGTFGTASNGGWTVDGFGNVGTTGAAKFNYYGTTTADHDWIISPNVNLTNKKASRLAFDIALTIWNTTTPTVMDANDTMFVVISTDGGNTFPRANVVAAYHAGTPISATGQREVVNLTAFGGQPNVRIGFYVKDLMGAGDKDFFLDNVALQEILQKDIEVLSVSMTPAPPHYVGSNVTVTAQIRNNGEEENPTSVPLTYKVGSAPTAYEDGNGEIFTPTWVGNVATVSFAAQINLTAPGDITTFVRSFYSGDQNGTNDVSSRTIKVLPAGALFEDFTDVNALSRWKVINGDGGANTWVRTTAKSLSAPASAGSLYESATVRNNDWLITPKLTVTATDSLTFWHSIQSTTFPESLYVRISTVGNSMSDPWTDLLAIRDATLDWKYKAISLAAYAGQNVWIAFVNRSLDMWTVYVDDISGPAVYVPAVDLAFTSFYQSSGLPTPKSGELFTDYNISMNEKSLENGVKPLASLIDEVNGAKASNENYSIVIPSVENVSSSKSFAPVDIKAEVKNVGLNAASYTLNWDVSGVAQTAYPGPSVDPATTHLADLSFTPSARGTFLTTGAIAVTGDENPDNNNNAFRMRVYPSEFTRTIYDRGDNLVDTWVGWGSATTAMKAGVRFTATASRKLAGVDFICNTEAVTSGTIVVQVRAAGGTTSAPGAVLYSKLYSSSDYFPGGGGYITFPFDDDAPVIASGSDYWITIKFPTGILYPGGVHNTGFTPGRSFYEGSTDTTVWNPLVLTTERAWIMRSYSVFAPSSISGVKFNDLNGNGIKDSGEPGLQGWFISLNGPINATVETDINGSYLFSDLPNGDYLITEDQQAGWLQTMPGAPGSYSVTITGGQSLVRNFGNYKYAKISGYKWLDVNGNGIWDSGEVPLAGWTINLAGPVNSSVVTNGSGYFEFLDLLAGNYTITETAQAGWLQTYPATSHSIPIISGDIIAGRSGYAEVPNFGNFRSGSISGYKFNDLNANGVWDSGEPTLAGWTINLTGAATRSTVTNQNGAYLFDGLVAGNYTVGETVQSGWIQSHPAAPGTHAVVIVSGSNIENQNFGNYRYASVAGIKFWDRNANGIKDAGEVGLEGWAIKLTGLVNPVRTTITNASGAYVFNNVVPDNYTLTEVVQPGWSITATPGSFVVVSGANVVDKNFGNFLSADSTKFRTFLHEDIVALDAKGKVPKAVKRKADKVEFEIVFTVPETGGPYNKLHVEWGSALSNSFSHVLKLNDEVIENFTITPPIDNKAKKFVYTFTNNLEAGDEISIHAFAVKGKVQKGKYWFSPVTKVVKSVMSAFELNEPRLPMPTYANLIEETFRDAGFVTTGLVIGSPHPEAPKDFGWVSIKKAADFQKSLRDKAVIHTGLPGFFDMFGTKFFRGEKKSVPPTKHNNVLFAELLALKLAIAASATGHSPEGLGDLVYIDDDIAWFQGKTLSEIADTVSKAMTYQLGDAESYYEVIRKINEAFAGTFDTVKFGEKTELTGTEMLASIPFLRAIPGMPITRITPNDNKYAEVPDIFELAQNYPNPFNPSTTIEFILPEDAMVTLKVYNILGQEVASLINNELYTEGRNDIEFDAGKLSSGVYFYRLTAEGFGEEAAKFSQVKKMVLMK